MYSLLVIRTNMKDIVQHLINRNIPSQEWTHRKNIYFYEQTPTKLADYVANRGGIHEVIGMV